jgi:hypothetical protein
MTSATLLQVLPRRCKESHAKKAMQRKPCKESHAKKAIVTRWIL